MRKGFKGFMNKVFKVVYSKSKGCYVVVPETAKNNNGKKKVLASVLAGLAVAGAMGGIAPQQAMAGVDTGNSHVNIWAETSPKSNGQNYNVGQNSIVVGYQNTTDNVAGHDGKVAIGAKNTSTNNASTAVGNENKATGGAATAVGAGNTASGKASVALGNVNNADAKAAIAIGTYNNVNYTKGSWQTTPKHAGEYSTVVGNYSSATGTSASAMGVYTNATGAGSFAAGYNNNANGQNSVAIGSENTSHVADTVTLGQFNNAKTMGGISIGKNNLTDSSNDGRNAANTRDENSQIAIGRDNVATHLDTIAIGRETTASGSGSTVVGARAEASGDNSIAIGQSGKGSPKVIASGVNSIAIGMQSQATGEAAIAEGAGSRAGGKYGIALGRKTKANAEAATALGNAAEANIANGVALGSSSVTTTDKGVLGYNPSDLHERKYDKLTGNVQTATTAAVSIGNGKQLTRQLTGLAAGTADTDAVNVAQLKNVGVAVTGNTGSSDFLADGGKLNVIGEGRVSTVAAHDGAKDSKITVGFDDKGMVKAGKNVKVDEVTVNGRTTYTIHAADAAAKYDFLTNAKANGGKLDGTATPTKVESGTTVSYAAGKNLTVKQDINQSAGEQTYTYSLNKDLKEITSITNNGGTTMNFGPNNISITGGNLDLGGNNITNLKSGGDTINNAANIGDVIRISKANDLHIAPTAGTNNNVTEYTVDANKKVTLTYQDGNGNTVNGPKAVIDLSGLKTGDMSSFNVKSSATEGKVAQGSAGVQEIRDGKTVEMQAGKNMTIKQTNKNGNAAVEFALNKDIDLTPDGSIKIGDTNITDNGLTINGGPSLTKTGINAGGLNITNVKAGVNDNDAVNVSQLKQVRADERHIKPGEYAVDANGKVTMTYLDGNNKDVANETAVITGIAKQDLSNINKGGETVIQNLAKKSIDMENGKNTKVSNREINGIKTFKVDVEGDLNDITSITNKAGDGKVVFGGNQTVNVAGDHNINLNAKVGDITGLTNVTLDAPDFAKKSRAATEEQLKIVNNGFNNTVGLTGNTGATELQKLNKQGGLSFGVVGANNGEYIKTTAAGSDVVADLSDSAKNKLNSTVEVQGKNAAKVTSTVVNNADGSTKTIYTVDVNNVKPTAASTEKVQAKADVAGSSDKNIAKVAPKAGENFGDAGATYEVNVSRNDVKDAAREAITVNTRNTTNNPITVTPVQDETNHNTTYTVTFDGNKAATQIPLTYKANGQNAQTVTLDKGLNFTNGRNTTASVDAEGVVKYDVNKDLVNINSISNTTNGPKMEFGPNSINITNGPINMGDQNITNLKSGGDVINNAANIGDVKRISKENDLHIAPTTSNRQGETTTSYVYDAASKSVTLKYNDGNGATQAGTIAKIDLSGLADQIKDGYSFSTDAKGNVVGNHAVTAVGNGKTVSYAAGKNLTVEQDIDATTGEHTYTYALSNNIDLTPNGSLKIGDTIVNNGGLTISGGPSITKTGINAGNLNITNVKAGVNNTDAVNVQQLKDARTLVTSNDNSVTINKTESGNQITYDLHVAPGAAQSVWNVKSSGNTTADSEATAKTITDGKTVEMVAGKNLTVKQTSNNDGAKVEYALSDDIKVGNDGKDGKPGKDGSIGVNGKDGSSVVINGKDGSIGLNGKDGKDGLTMKAENGQPGVNGKDGITRIVYEDKTNTKHEVATLDDGLKFTGNNTDTVNNHKLNSLVKVQGEGVDKTTSATFKSAAGNINVKADGTDTLEVQLNKDLKNITTIKNDGPATLTIGGNEFKFSGGNVNMGDNNITNLKSGGDVINNAANIGDVNRISKANDKHIKPGEYGVDNNGKVTMTYVDGNNKDISNETAVITGIAKSDLSNITKGGETVIQNIAKKSIDMEDGKNTKASNRDVNGVKTFKVDVEGDLTDVTSITNKTGDGKVSFVGNQTVNVAGDHNIALNAKAGDITGLTNVTLNSADFATKGRAATEEQLKIVNNGFNNTVGLTGNTGATDLQKLNQAGGLSFGVIGANNGQYIKTTAAGSNVAVDLSDDAKAKLNNTVEVRGKNAAKVTSVTENTADGGKKTIYTVDVDNVKPTAASTEKVQAKADVAGSSDKNIAKVTPQVGDQFGDAGATYEVNVSRNDVKDAAREAVTVNTTNTTNNPITVTPVQDETNHNTTYTVTFDGNKAATQIPLTYKANGQNAQTVTLDKGLNFTNGSNTTASVAADGVVKYDLNNNIDLTPNGSLKIGDTIVNNGGLTISGGPSITKTGINAGNLNITNVKAGVNNTDAVNVQQLKDARTLVTSNDNSVTINKTESGNQITYDLHVAPGAAQSVWNVKSSGNTTADSEATAKTITDGKTVEMVAGKNLTVKQTSNNDGAKVEYALSDDIKVGNDGKDGKPGKDGSIGVNGKDGSSVVINGKDGSIGLNGKDGKDGLTMKAENGQPGVNGKDGITRIVYEDKTNTKHEVATLDDGLKFTGNNTDTVNNHKLNSLVKVQGEGVDKTTSATFKSAAGNINVKADGTDTLEVQLNKDLKNITTIKNDGPATLTIGGNEFKFSGGNVNMGDNNITNLKSGGDVINNAANIGDVKRISKANDLHIAPTTSNRAGETTATYAYNTADKSVTLKYNDGNGATQTGTIAKIDLSGLADQIKDGYSFSTDAKGNVVGNHAVTAVGNGKTVSYAAGDNLTIAQHIDNTTGEQTYTYALSNDIKVGNDGKDGKPGVDGKIGVNGKDGSSVVINGKDGSIGLNGKDGKDGLTMKAKDGQPGVNGKDGITRIVYEDNNKNTHEVATLDDGMKYAGDDAQGADKSKVIAKKLNETMDVVGGADKSKLTDNNIGVNNVDGKLKVQLSKEVNLTPSGSLTIGDTVVNNNGLTISGGPSITKTGINAGNKTIVNVDAGVNDTDAVNVQQLKKAKTEVKAGNNVTVDTTYGNDGHTIYTVNANDVALGDAVLKYSANGTNTQSVKLSQGLNFVDGNYTSASVDANGQVKYDVTIGKVKDGVDGKPGVDGKDGIATVKTVVDTINNSGWKGDVTGNTVNNHTATIVKPGTTVNFGAGKNLTVEQIVDQVTGNHTYNYALSDDIKVGHDGKDGKPGVDGKIGVNGKDGSSVVINGKDGSIGLNGKDGKDGLTMKAKDGQPGVNGKDGITRIVYEDNNKNTHEVATLDDGMKYAGDDAQGTDKSKVIAKKLNQTMDIVGGANSTKLTDNNIGVNNVDGKLKVQLAQNIDLTPAGSLTIGGTSITDNGLVINQGPSITKGGINAGNQFITNVKAGVNNTDAVNVAQLKSAKTEVEEGDNVKVTSRTGADGQTIYKVSAKAVNLGDAELKYSANGTNTQSVKLSQGLNFVDGNYTTASVDANGQVKYDVTIGKVKDGVDGKPGVDGKDGIATVKTVVDTINNSGWKANATGNVVGNSTATIVKPGNTVNYGAGKNLNVKQTVNGDEQTYEFALDKDLKELNSVQTKNIYLGSPTSHTTITYNNDNSRIEYTTKEGDKKQVANLDDIWTIQANGTDVKPVGGKVNVVGGDHIKVSTDAAGKMTISADGLGTMNGFNVKSTGNTTSDSDKTAKNITDGKTVEFSGGKNLTVKQTNTGDGAKVEFALNNNIDLTPNGSVTIGDTVVNNDGLTITGGPTITKNNVDMGGQQIHNVKSGGDVDSNGANIGDIKRISKANDTRIKDGNYEVSQNGTVEMTYVDGAGKQVVDANGNPVKATISGIARQDLSNITNEGKKVITGLSSIVKGGNNVTVDTSVDNTTGQKTYTVNADLSGAKVNASVGADGSGVAKGLKNPVKVEKGTQYIAGDNMVVERKPVEGDDKIDNSITYSLAHDLTEIRSISNGGATLRINSNPGSVPGDRAPATPAFEVHGGNLSMTGNRIVNLAPGIDGTDGVNVDQLKGSRTTLTSEDHSVTLNRTDNGQGGYNYDLSVKGVNDPRVNILNEEIGLVGAQGAALSALKPMQYDPMEPTQIMAGYGNYRGNSALALGVAHYKNESTMFHGGISWAGGSSHMMANAGVTWKIGNRDSEGAVADRYRKGPISSTYAMQTEVASMKAQNAGLKGEVSDLKAENEQIKAQNAGLQNEVDQLKAQMAAMMARLGM